MPIVHLAPNDIMTLKYIHTYSILEDVHTYVNVTEQTALQRYSNSAVRSVCSVYLKCVLSCFLPLSYVHDISNSSVVHNDTSIRKLAMHMHGQFANIT